MPKFFHKNLDLPPIPPTETRSEEVKIASNDSLHTKKISQSLKQISHQSKEHDLLLLALADLKYISSWKAMKGRLHNQKRLELIQRIEEVLT